MATYSKSKVALVVTLGMMPVVLIALFVVNTFVYPFRSATPNFADVEAVYNKLQIPSEWQVIEESENRGIAGRQCPVEPGTVCFSKEKIFKIPIEDTAEDIVNVFKTSGCTSPVVGDKREYGQLKFSTDVECATGLIVVSGTLRETNEKTMSVRVRTE